MADPVVHITAGVPDSGTGNITTLGQTLLDGANVTFGAKADARSTATDATAITAMQVLKQISFSEQATAAALAGTITVSGNTAQINGVAPLMGNGVTGTGSLRVTVASDNTAFAVNAAATLAAETTKVIGTVRNLGNAGAILDFAGQNAASPANSMLMGGQFNTTPTTITTGNASPLQLDNAGNLLVNIKAGSSAGTQYTEDAAAAADPVGNMLVAVRRDTLSTSEVSADGDNIALKATNKGKLHVASEVRLGDTAADTGSGAMSAATQRVALATDSPGVIATGTAGTPASTVLTMQGIASMTPVLVAGFQVTCTTDITRPADTTAYTANDTWSDSTSAPTAGGFTLTGAARASGGSGVITDLYVMSSAVPGTLLQGEIHLFDSAATAVNDNAAWNLSDADAKLRVGIIPFTLVADANNSYYHAQNLNIGFTCVGTANLRYLVKVKNAYTPVSAEVLTVRAKIIQNT